jgi:putative ABC transport system ATP-binding protein
MLLTVRDLQRPGLEPVSFDLDAGEAIVVMGPSGSGKTLLLRALADLDPNRGRVELDGQRRDTVPAPRWRRQVCFVAAEPGWWADTVGGHFADWSAAEPLVRVLGLPGECRDWPVLLLDEPTSGLDEMATAAVETLIAERRAEGAAVLWVSHDPGQAARIARRRLAVADGRVTEVAA